MQRLRGGLVFKAHRLCVSLNSRLESNEERDYLVVGGVAVMRVLRGRGRHRLCALLHAAHVRQSRPDSGLGFQVKSP